MSPRIGATILGAVVLFAGALNGDTVAVRHQEGLVRGFLVLRSLDGKILAGVDNFRTAESDRVTIKLVYRFRDGSFREETTVFTRAGSSAS